MKLKYMLKLEQFMEVGFTRQFALAFILMSLVPIVLFVYIIYSFGLNALIENDIPYFNITMLLMVLLSLAGYDLVRRNVVALYLFVTQAQELLKGRVVHGIEVRSTGEVGRDVQ